MRPLVIAVALQLLAAAVTAQFPCPANGLLATPDFMVTPAPVFSGVPLTLNMRDPGPEGLRNLVSDFITVSVIGTDIFVDERYVDFGGNQCHAFSRPIGTLAVGTYTVRVRYEAGYNEPFFGKGTAIGTFNVVSAGSIPALDPWLLALLLATLCAIGVMMAGPRTFA